MSTQALYRGLIDDAAMFPPALTPLPDAVDAHLAHRRTEYADLVGPFLVSDRSLADLRALRSDNLSSDNRSPALDLGLVVSGGAGAIGPAITHAARIDGATLLSVETALRNEDDLARNAERVVTMLDLELPEGATASIEMPRLGDDPPTGSWWDAADAVAAAGHRLKFRTGGEWADAYPPADELAGFVAAALDRECPFKLTAGLHNAIRHTADDGSERHGFLNVLLATHVLLSGGAPADAAAALERRDGTAVADEIGDWDDAEAERVRTWFVSIGSCSIDEPVADLRELGLLS